MSVSVGADPGSPISPLTGTSAWPTPTRLNRARRPAQSWDTLSRSSHERRGLLWHWPQPAELLRGRSPGWRLRSPGFRRHRRDLFVSATTVITAAATAAAPAGSEVPRQVGSRLHHSRGGRDDLVKGHRRCLWSICERTASHWCVTSVGSLSGVAAARGRATQVSAGGRGRHPEVLWPRRQRATRPRRRGQRLGAAGCSARLGRRKGRARVLVTCGARPGCHPPLPARASYSCRPRAGTGPLRSGKRKAPPPTGSSEQTTAGSARRAMPLRQRSLAPDRRLRCHRHARWCQAAGTQDHVSASSPREGQLSRPDVDGHPAVEARGRRELARPAPPIYPRRICSTWNRRVCSHRRPAPTARTIRTGAVYPEPPCGGDTGPQRAIPGSCEPSGLTAGRNR